MKTLFTYISLLVLPAVITVTYKIGTISCNNSYCTCIISCNNSYLSFWYYQAVTMVTYYISNTRCNNSYTTGITSCSNRYPTGAPIIIIKGQLHDVACIEL